MGRPGAPREGRWSPTGFSFFVPSRNLCAARLLVCSGGTGNRQPFMKAARCNARAAFLFKSPRVLIGGTSTPKVWDDPGYGKQMRPLLRQPFKARTTEELMALLSAVATSILAVIIISMLYFGRDIFVPIALGYSSQLRAGAAGRNTAAHPYSSRISGRKRGHPCLHADFRDGKSSRHATDATRGRPPSLPIDDKRKDPVLSRHKSRQGDAGARLRHAEGSQQRAG